MPYWLLAFVPLLIAKTASYIWLHKPKTYLVAVIDSLAFGFFICAQQVALFLFWYLLALQFGLVVQVLLSGVVFALLHSHFFLTHRRIDAYLLVTAGFLGGMLFAHMYSTYVLGIYLAFAIHIGFHVALDIFYVLYWGKPIRDLQSR